MTRAERKSKIRALAKKTGKRSRGAANILAREEDRRVALLVNAETSAPPEGAVGCGPRSAASWWYYDENGLWYPLRRDGEWLRAADWERNLRVLRRRGQGRRALTALAEVFAPPWSREQSGTEDLHPVAYDSITIGGRHELLEVGWMLATMREKKRLGERLLPKHEYHGTCAELRGGLLLRTAGAELEWEPVKAGPGPDWLARWKSGVLAVEVKAPRESKRALARQAVLSDFFFEFMRCASDAPALVNTGIWLTLHPSRGVLEAKTVLGSPDREAVRVLAREGADAVRAHMPRPAVAGRFPAGRAGEFTVALGLGAEPQIQFMMEGLDADHEHEEQRVLDIVQDAAGQLRAVDAPGLVIIDAGADVASLAQLPSIYEALLSEKWASKLAGVAVVVRSTSVDEDLAELRTDTTVRIVPGLQGAALENTLLSSLRMCDRGHLHSDSLMAPAGRCQVLF